LLILKIFLISEITVMVISEIDFRYNFIVYLVLEKVEILISLLVFYYKSLFIF